MPAAFVDTVEVRTPATRDTICHSDGLKPISRVDNRLELDAGIGHGQDGGRLDRVVLRVEGGLAGEAVELDLLQCHLHLGGVLGAGLFDAFQQQVCGIVCQGRQPVRSLGPALVVLVVVAERLDEVLDFRARVLGRVLGGEEAAGGSLDIESRRIPGIAADEWDGDAACLGLFGHQADGEVNRRAGR